MLLGFNLTTLPLTIAGGFDTITQVASSAGAFSEGKNIGSSLRPDLTVDPQRGVAGGLTLAQLAAIQAQVDAGELRLRWSAMPEFNTGALVIDSPFDTTDSVFEVVVSSTGDDNNSNKATAAQPVRTLPVATNRIPSAWKGPFVRLKISGDVDWNDSILSNLNIGSHVGLGCPLLIEGDAPAEPLGAALAAQATTTALVVVTNAATVRKGAAASIVAGATAGSVRVSGMTGANWTSTDKGKQVLLRRCNSLANIGTFTIGDVVDGITVDLINADAVVGDLSNGAIYWQESFDGSALHCNGTAITSTLNGAISAADTTITLASAASFPTPANNAPSTIKIGNELITYLAKSGNQLQQCMRGVMGTEPEAHADTTAVMGGSVFWQARQIAHHGGVAGTSLLTCVAKASMANNQRFTLVDTPGQPKGYEYNVTGGFTPTGGFTTIDITSGAIVTADDVAAATLTAVLAGFGTAQQIMPWLSAPNLVSFQQAIEGAAGNTTNTTAGAPTFTLSNFTGGLGALDTTFVVNAQYGSTTVPAVPAVGNTFAVQSPVSKIKFGTGPLFIQYFEAGGGAFGLKNVIFEENGSLLLGMRASNVQSELVHYRMNGAQVSWTNGDNYASGVNAGFSQWQNAGRLNPFAATARIGVGSYFQNAVLAYSGNSRSNGHYGFQTCSISMVGGIATFTSINTKKTTITAVDAGFLAATAGRMEGQLTPDASLGIINIGAGMIANNLAGLEISGSAGHGIALTGHATALLTTVTGRRNVGNGIKATGGSQATVTAATTITGNAGCIKVGLRPARTWPNFTGTAPVNTEFDVTGDGSRISVATSTAHMPVEVELPAIQVATFTAAMGQLYRLNPTALLTANLPVISAANKGQRIELKNSSALTNAITVTPNGAQTVDGAATYVMNIARQAVTLVSDGVSNWEVM